MSDRRHEGGPLLDYSRMCFASERYSPSAGPVFIYVWLPLLFSTAHPRRVESTPSARSPHVARLFGLFLCTTRPRTFC